MSRFASVWQYLMYLLIAAFVPVCYLWAVIAVMEGWGFLLAAGVIIVSVDAAWIIRRFVEREPTKGMFSLRTQSWAFVLGDGILLPLALLAFTPGWKKLDPTSAYIDWDWFFLGLAAGVMLAVAFRMLDSKRYVWAGRESALYCPTKVWHDFAVVPLVGGVLTWAALPQMVEAWSVYTSFGCVALIGYVALVIRDHVAGVDVTEQHTGWNVHTFEAA